MQNNSIFAIMLSIIAESSSFTHLAGTLNGLSTVLALNAEKVFQTEFDQHQDTHPAFCYMSITTSAAFGLNLDIIYLIFMFCRKESIFFRYLKSAAKSINMKNGFKIYDVVGITAELQK